MREPGADGIFGMLHGRMGFTGRKANPLGRLGKLSRKTLRLVIGEVPRALRATTR
jgi:hypothetical protein